MSGDSGRTVHVLGAMAEIDAGQWNALANPRAGQHDPFVSHAFLDILERSGSITRKTGWLPQHLLLKENGQPIGAMPCYVKSHSMGEFIFDHHWADAYEQSGRSYYPKLLSAVPVTPVPGHRFLVADDDRRPDIERQLAAAAIALAKRCKASSLHVNFLTEGEWQRLGDAGLMQRTALQYHWTNAGYDSFEAFLDTLASRKRKALRRERRDALADGITVEWLTGKAITEAHWDAFFAFYTDTGSRKWGSPYLNRRFFSMLGEAMSERVLLVFANRGGTAIAGALNMIGGEALYGRYWGCLEQRPFLHFELCYYQAIDFAIARGLKRVEAGAGGEHKLVRGYLPVTVHSAHWIADPRFRAAIADYLDRERRHVAAEGAALEEFAPFRKPEPS